MHALVTAETVHTTLELSAHPHRIEQPVSIRLVSLLRGSIREINYNQSVYNIYGEFSQL